MTGLRIHCEEKRNDLVYFELEGYLDAHNFEKLDAVFEKYFNRDMFRFVVDVRGLGYISSAGAGIFIGAVGTCQDNNGNVVLVHPSQEVKETFELLGVYQIFPVVNGIDQAKEYFDEEEREAAY